jgi:hypothetical protein
MESPRSWIPLNVPSAGPVCKHNCSRAPNDSESAPWWMQAIRLIRDLQRLQASLLPSSMDTGQGTSSQTLRRPSNHRIYCSQACDNCENNDAISDSCFIGKRFALHITHG